MYCKEAEKFTAVRAGRHRLFRESASQPTPPCTAFKDKGTGIYVRVEFLHFMYKPSVTATIVLSLIAVLSHAPVSSLEVTPLSG